MSVIIEYTDNLWSFVVLLQINENFVIVESL